jgi:FtsH-binding integral membrane protein
MSPSEKMLHQTPSLMRELKRKRKSAWGLTMVALLLISMCGLLVFTVEEFYQYKTEFILITGGYFVLFILYLRRNKRKMSDLIEMENRARRELGR